MHHKGLEASKEEEDQERNKDPAKPGGRAKCCRPIGCGSRSTGKA